MKRNRNEEGFTLIEMMVVIVIIGILTTVVVLNVLPDVDKAAITRARAGRADPYHRASRPDQLRRHRPRHSGADRCRQRRRGGKRDYRCGRRRSCAVMPASV